MDLVDRSAQGFGEARATAANGRENLSTRGAVAGNDDSAKTKILTASALPQPSSPIAITNCTGILATSSYDVHARGTLLTGVRIKNVGTKTVKATRFRFDFQTEFDEIDIDGSGVSESVEGSYAPDTKIDLVADGRFFGRPREKPTFFTPHEGSVWSAEFNAELKAAKGAPFPNFVKPKYEPDTGRLIPPDTRS